MAQAVIIENRERDIKRLGDFEHDGKILRVVIGSTDDEKQNDAKREPVTVAECEKDRVEGFITVFHPEIRIPGALYKALLAKAPIKLALEGWKASGAIKVYPAT